MRLDENGLINKAKIEKQVYKNGYKYINSTCCSCILIISIIKKYNKIVKL